MKGINWNRLYEMLADLTPLAEDCGRLCRKKCCSLLEEGLGVFLFPGEEVLFGGEGDWCSVVEYSGENEHFTGKSPRLLNCRGRCPREKRPLACRLFPLAPRIDQAGDLEIILDPDALFICPLVRLNNLEALDPAFREGVRRVWLELLKEAPVRDGVRRYSARIDSQSADPWNRLLGR